MILVSTLYVLHEFASCIISVSKLLIDGLSSIDSSISNASGAESLAIQPQKLLILDARSYAAAVANRAKGGGCECPGKQIFLS